MNDTNHDNETIPASVDTSLPPPPSPCSLVIPENAKSVSHRNLPELKPEHRKDGTILLFYQYVEPQWTKAQHKAALKKVIEIGNKYNITGRGRVAQEGLNCTLTGRPDDIRSFCYKLREWNDVFNETDFKLTDGVPMGKIFKSLSIRKTNELVAYGLEGGKFRCSAVMHSFFCCVRIIGKLVNLFCWTWQTLGMRKQGLQYDHH